MNSVRIYIEFSLPFKKQLKKLNPKIIKKLNNLLKILAENPYNPKLKTHKLRGKLKNKYAFYVSPNIRVIFTYINKTTVLLIGIGSHDDLYR